MKAVQFAMGILATSLFCMPVCAQGRFDDVKVSATALKGSVHMLEGAGGNIGVSAGDDGIVIIDDQYEPLAEKIADALGKLGSNAPKYIVNTHFHGDHTGSNGYFHNQNDTTIFAHSNVRIRLADDEQLDASALPVVTYEDGMTFHFNKETIHVFHLPDAHTDGDSAVWFEQPNVLHTGDLFFNELFPFIDLNSGGTVLGYIAAVESLLERIDDETIIIPGHGKLADKADLSAFLTMIKTTNTAVDKLKQNGMTEEQVVKHGLEEKWRAWSWRFIDEERWIRTLYRS